MLEYVERVLGYAPKSGRDRLRVARKLESLPRMAAALDAGALPFSAVRELSRFVTPETEAEWLEATRGKSLREIEELSSGRRPGSRPGDPSDPDIELRPVTLDLTPPTLGLFRDARRRLEEELGHPLTDDELVHVLCSAVLDHAPRGAEPEVEAQVLTTSTRTAPRVPPYQIALVVCEYCDRAWHDATGKSIEVPTSTVAQACCDAQYLGYVDGEAPARAFQEVPPAVARMVIRRDRGRCRVPGCRSSRWIHIHHILAREHGGTNEPSNLVCLCSAHHQALHRAQIGLSGRAPDALVFDLRRFAL